MSDITSYVCERDLEVALADGVRLRVDVYRRPDGEPRPTLFQYTAYNKSNWGSVNGVIAPARATAAGFNVVVADARNRFTSGGDEPFRPFRDDGVSAAACIDWIVDQPWATDRVGMYGASNNGVPQWQALREGSPNLATIVPHFSASEYDHGWVWRGGAFQLGFNLWWTLANLAPDMARRAIERGDVEPEVFDRLRAVLADPTDAFATTPLDAVDVVGELTPHYLEWLAHPPGDPYWSATSLAGRWDDVTVPVLHVAGWFNVHLDGNLANYEAMRGVTDPAVVDAQYLIVGPWTQWAPGLMGDSCGPERRFPIAFDMEALQLSWFDHHLAGGPDPELPRVKAFLMGTDTWVDVEDWPPPSAVATRWYLHSDGGANGATGDGTLSLSAPGDEPADRYFHDPRDPVPTVGGAAYLPNPLPNSGPRDQREVQARRDVLVYVSEPLTEPVTVLGPVTATVHLTSTEASTDLCAKLVDISPDGRAELLCDGIVRTAAPGSGSGASPVLVPGEPTEVEVDLIATGNVFGVGHRIGLELASTNFPKFDRHPGPDGDPQPAIQQVHHDAEHPSVLVLPVLPSR